MPRDSTTHILAGLHSAAGCCLCSQESVLSVTHADGRPSYGFKKNSQRQWRIDVATWIIIFGMAACRLLAHGDSAHERAGFIFNVCAPSKLPSLAAWLDPAVAVLGWQCGAVVHVCHCVAGRLAGKDEKNGSHFWYGGVTHRHGRRRYPRLQGPSLSRR